MVNRLGVIGLLSLWLLCSSAWAEVKVYPKSVQLGEPITLVLLGENIEQDFAQVDKDPIRRLFEIYDVDGNANRVRLTLYPLETGTLQLPAMQQGQIAFDGMDIEVKDNPNVSLDWQKPALTQAYLSVSEPYLWGVSVKAPAEYSVVLEAHPHQTTASKSLLKPDPVQVESTLFGEERHFKLAYWAEQPTAELALRSPVVRVKNPSQRTWLFFDKTQRLAVKSLPNYLPLRLPIGRLQIAQTPLPFWLEAGELNVWSLSLLAQNVTAERLPNLAQALEQTNNDLEWLTPSSHSNVTWTQQGWQQQQDWQLPFRIKALGWVSLPALRLSYFDISSGQLQDVWLPSSVHIAVPGWLMLLVKWSTWLSVLVMLGSLLLIAKGFWQKWRVQQEMAKAQSVEQVWQVLRNYDLARVWVLATGAKALNPAALTLEGVLLNTAKVPHETLALIKAFNQHFYDLNKPLELSAAQKMAQDWLQRQSVFYKLLNELRTIRYFLKATPKA